MKLFVTITYILLVHTCSAQFAIITDPDGYTNVRATPEKGENIIDKLQNGDIVFHFEATGNWINIDYCREEEIKNGYIYKDRFKFISDCEEIPTLKVTDSSVQLKKGEINITVKQQDFAPSKHTFTYDKEYKNFITHIDKRLFFGTDGNMPTTEYQSITIDMGSKKIITLPASAIGYLYQPSLEATKAYYNHATDILYITSWNSDGAGGYTVIWEIVNKAYKGRSIVNGF